VLTATGFVNGRWQFSTPTESAPLDRSPTKFGTGDYVGVPYSCAKFDANPGMWVKYEELFLFIYTLFMNSPTGKTRRRIFTIDGSNDADSPMGVHFGGFIDTAAHVGGEIPRKPPILGRE